MIRIKRTLREIFFECVGSFLVAISVINFAAAAHFPMTGFSGLSLIFNRLFDVPIGFTIVVLNVPVAALCYKLLGRGFFLRSVRCLLISSAMMDYLAPLFPLYQGNKMIAAICAGVIGGIGYAIIYTQNSSTGGTDFAIMAIKALKPYVSLGKIAFLSDIGIILIGGWIFKDVDGMVYGMIINFLYAVAVDKVIYGVNSGKLALIVTENGKLVSDAIDDCCGRGSTILHGQGGFQQDDKQVVMCACDNKQMYFVQQKVREVDPAAFTIVLESNEVHGQGFNVFAIGDKNK